MCSPTIPVLYSEAGKMYDDAFEWFRKWLWISNDSLALSHVVAKGPIKESASANFSQSGLQAQLVGRTHLALPIPLALNYYAVLYYG